MRQHIRANGIRRQAGRESPREQSEPSVKWLLHPRATLVIDGIAGAVLLVFGVLILVEAAHRLL